MQFIRRSNICIQVIVNEMWKQLFRNKASFLQLQPEFFSSNCHQLPMFELQCCSLLGHIPTVLEYSSLIHITSVCSKAKQILGLLYRRFYNHAEGTTLMQLNLSLIRPHLEYACPVWDPHTMKDKVLLEDVQKFALQMATKQWDLGYQELLDTMNIPSLADHRLQLKLALLYKIVHGMCYFPSDILCTPTNYSVRTNHSLVIDQPYVRTNVYF